ncbi:molybdate ABC transporter substrate-binding protein [Aquibacillus sp. 3ASR75-11]|uniref:Molybdate ABC transporter substrate-binding protein n=1 Tax=Terrihalobacillus insolitus TaxID=2950438 RepID=A0A9X3WU62_9BACI|nr:molybdate ABC transporter substrate-binding protein [Terrihalobacillus insolitus]MDC3413560.1 molybdate ABC transporter substrate-binding protein [Terrihalobacillus insolitus]MDC3424683.1 molybdate ABC transporter substrate-binding protein [Terrihalobacillus insolitus]
MKKKIYLFIWMLSIVWISGCANDTNNVDKEKVTLSISAASSLTVAIDEIKAMYEERNNIKLEINYASSGTLVNQMKQGAPVDVFVSASKEWMNQATEEGLIDKSSVVPLLYNRLVFGTNEKNEQISFEDMVTTEKAQIAIGDPESVPVGAYAKEVLQNKNLWDTWQSKLVYAKNARQVAVYVESGNVDAGFLFQSDAIAFKTINVIEVIPESLHSPIVYPAGITTQTANEEGASQFLRFLQSETAQSIFKTYGFEVR